MSSSLKIAIVMAAATIGSGIFALPFIFFQSGWLPCFIFFIVLAVVVSYAHVIYADTLRETGDEYRLLGLAKKCFGQAGFWIAFCAIVIGLLLSFTAYLILGRQFIHLIFPALGPMWSLAIFWVLISTPVFLRDGRLVEYESVGIILLALIVLFVFVLGAPSLSAIRMPEFGPASPFLPFGPVLFALAGWTGVEQAYELKKRSLKSGGKSGIVTALFSGTLIAGLIYVMFAMGILGTASRITTDTVSGLFGWPAWERILIAVFGLFALWTVSMPVSREIFRALSRDLGWKDLWARVVIVGLPLGVVLLGFNNFLTVIGILGGIFLPAQYLLIISVGRRILSPSATQKVVFDIVALLFVVAAVYSFYSFIVK